MRSTRASEGASVYSRLHGEPEKAIDWLSQYHAVRPPTQVLRRGERPVAEIEVTVSDADQRVLIAP